MRIALAAFLLLIGMAGPVLADNTALVCYKAAGTPNCVPVTSSTPLPVVSSGGGSAPVTTVGSLVTGQVVVAVTGTAVQFPANANLVNGILVTACGGYPPSASTPVQHVNAAGVTVGNSSITNACTGSGNGDCIGPGAGHGYGINNTNLLYLNGVAGDCVTFEGN